VTIDKSFEILQRPYTIKSDKLIAVSKSAKKAFQKARRIPNSGAGLFCILGRNG